MATSQVADRCGGGFWKERGSSSLQCIKFAWQPLSNALSTKEVKRGGGDSPGLFIHLFLFWMLLRKLSHLSIFANWSCVVKEAPQPYQSSLPCSYLCEAVPFWPVVWSHSVSLYTDFQCLCGLLAAPYVVPSCHYQCCKWQLLTLIATSHRATNKHDLPNVRLPEGTILFRRVLWYCLWQTK